MSLLTPAATATGIAGLVVGSLVSPPDPTSQLTLWPMAFACCLPIAYWLVGSRTDAGEDGVLRP